MHVRIAAGILAALSIMFVSNSCNNRHFISDKSYRQQVEKDLELKESQYGAESGLFSFTDIDGMTAREKEAMEFLYAYMPLGDIADYPADFHLMNVRAAFRAQSEMPWGKIVPEQEFRHFVLPARVNNENLDSSRVVFYRELKDRIKGLDLNDAIIEVNHWCHEKAVYTPSDARTSSPLATVKTAYGRCGEESTFLVAALRSVGIPARQVYTPRWAHTDDNHAWVEAYGNDGWHFLGACEPEPVLDLGWFNAPASRGMLMHTKVFGRYAGSEEVMSSNPVYTEINVTANYAPVAKAEVIVTDSNGKPAEGAKVEFKIYNYGEFFSAATKTTDTDGKAWLTAGRGDMMAWASKDGLIGCSKISFGSNDSYTIVLGKEAGELHSAEYDIVPPSESANLPQVSAEMRAGNDRRMAQEDSIRNAYTATFFTMNSAGKWIDELMSQTYRNNSSDKVGETLRTDIAGILTASRGNHEVITKFLEAEIAGDGIHDFKAEQQQARLSSILSRKVMFLRSLSAKDLRDVSLDILLDHYSQAESRDIQEETFVKFVLNPRVANEMLSTYKSGLRDAFTPERLSAFASEPQRLVDWVKDSIRIDKACNLGCSPISPYGVFRSRTANSLSRDIFFVAAARTAGIPARIDAVTGKVQLVEKDGFTDVDIDNGIIGSETTPANSSATGRGLLKASYTPVASLDNPKYYNHFTISKLTPEGRLQLLNYEEGDADTEGASWKNLLKDGCELDEGRYLLVTGTRMADGTVLARALPFDIEKGRTTQVNLVMREDKERVQVIGTFNSESLFTHNGSKESLLQACGRGYFIVGILGPGQEPTNHALKDIEACREDIEKWGRKMVLLFPNEEKAGKFIATDFPNLPENIIYGIDTEGIASDIAQSMNLRSAESLPIFIIADTFNRVVFVKQGYTIGLGAQLLTTISGL